MEGVQGSLRQGAPVRLSHGIITQMYWRSLIVLVHMLALPFVHVVTTPFHDKRICKWEFNFYSERSEVSTQDAKVAVWFCLKF